jgi:hypothetical protein
VTAERRDGPRKPRKVIPVKRKLFVVFVIVLVCLGACSCSRNASEKADASDTESSADESAWSRRSEGEGPSAAARSRGVPPHARRGDIDEAAPQIAVRGFDYEWRLEPDKGLHVRIDFVNTRQTYERARGYLFLVASSSTVPGIQPGVYPWDARFQEGYPESHTDGHRLLFREELEHRAFIPFRQGDGYFDRLKILVYHEDGTIAINLDYDLEITGEPTGPIEAKPLAVTM